MYICVCKAITDKQIQEATKSCSNFTEACKRLGVGTECGVCLQDAIMKHNPRFQKKSTTKKSK